MTTIDKRKLPIVVDLNQGRIMILGLISVNSIMIPIHNFTGNRLIHLATISLFKDWVYFGCLSLSFSFLSSVCIIQFATISMVRVVMDIFINQNASKLFIDFLLCVLLKYGARGFFVLARVCSYCAGVNL